MLSTMRIVRALRHQRMPLTEIRAVLTTDDPLVVHRYLELHRERLEEWLSDERSRLTTLEHAIVGPEP